MTISDIIQPGDKIDIKLIQQIETEEESGITAKMYESQVLDVKEDGCLEIMMPLERGRLVLLPLGIRFEFVFYSMGSLYRSVGQIRDRYKTDNMYVLLIELKSRPEKHQRREFYRYACIIDTLYYVISEQEASMDTIEAMFMNIRENIAEREREGTIVDISGGGVRFFTEVESSVGDFVLLCVQLSSDDILRQHYIVAKILSCQLKEYRGESRYEIRAQFLIKDDKIREEIIRYIFEEERRTLQRENV